MINSKIELGLVGTGFIARGFYERSFSNGIHVNRVLTRRNNVEGFNGELTNDPEDLFNSDIVLIATGDPIYGTDIANGVLEEGIPVVTMDAELQITSGHHLAKKGLFTEAQGDQPGSTAVLREEALEMGIDPIVYGNVKGFLNLNPTRPDMEYWAKKQGISLQQVTSFTDGTKVQIEQALIANAFGATISRPGLEGVRCETMRQGAKRLAEIASNKGEPISDYILPKSGNPGVFIVGEGNGQQEYFDYYKVGIPETHWVFLERPFHLCHLEIPATIKRVMEEGRILLNNSDPRINVGAIAKHDLEPGTRIDKAIGSFELRGEAMLVNGYIPIGLIQNAVIEKRLERGEIVDWNHVSIPDSLAKSIWQT